MRSQVSPSRQQPYILLPRETYHVLMLRNVLRREARLPCGVLWRCVLAGPGLRLGLSSGLRPWAQGRSPSGTMQTTPSFGACLIPSMVSSSR